MGFPCIGWAAIGAATEKCSGVSAGCAAAGPGSGAVSSGYSDLIGRCRVLQGGERDLMTGWKAEIMEGKGSLVFALEKEHES